MLGRFLFSFNTLFTHKQCFYKEKIQYFIFRIAAFLLNIENTAFPNPVSKHI